MKKNIKLLIIIIDLLALLGLYFLYNSWNNNKEIDNNLHDETGKKQTVVFKKFIYKFSPDIKYFRPNYEEFVLVTENATNVIEIFIDEQHDIFKDPERFYRELLNEKINVSNLQKINVDDKEIITFDKIGDSNSVLCYLNALGDYYYRIDIFNNDNSFSRGNIIDVIKELSSVEYDYNSNELFEYNSLVITE